MKSSSLYIKAIASLTAASLCFFGAFPSEAAGELTHAFRSDPERGVWCHGEYDDGETRIALTFDDGPHRIYTEKVLDVLERYGVRATFFVIGSNVEDYPELVLREIAAGHEIGSHTYSHLHIIGQSEESIEEELRHCENVLRDCASVRPRLFRPPEGVYGEGVLRAAAAFGYKVIYWSVDTRDWTHPSVEKIVDNVLNNTRGGSIILFHDFAVGKSETIEALEKIIPELQKRGYEFVTVSELIGE